MLVELDSWKPETIVLLSNKKCVIACVAANNLVNWYLSASLDWGEQSQFMCSYIKMARDWVLDSWCRPTYRIERSCWQYWFPSRMENGNFSTFSGFSLDQEKLHMICSNIPSSFLHYRLKRLINWGLLSTLKQWVVCRFMWNNFTKTYPLSFITIVGVTYTCIP